MFQPDDLDLIGQRQAVLLVEDNPTVQKALESLLLALNYDVDTAHSGEQALALLPGGSYHAVICDVLMPGMCGDELFAVCRREHPELARRFIFLTGSASEGRVAAFLQAAGQPWLAKPCGIAAVQEAINRIAVAV